jgi:hypothetical protein
LGWCAHYGGVGWDLGGGFVGPICDGGEVG